MHTYTDDRYTSPGLQITAKGHLAATAPVAPARADAADALDAAGPEVEAPGTSLGVLII